MCVRCYNLVGSPRFSIRLALKALSHVSLGHHPRNSNRHVKSALKARFNRAESDSRFQRGCLGTINPGAMPQAFALIAAPSALNVRFWKNREAEMALNE